MKTAKKLPRRFVIRLLVAISLIEVVLKYLQLLPLSTTAEICELDLVEKVPELMFRLVNERILVVK